MPNFNISNIFNTTTVFNNEFNNSKLTLELGEIFDATIKNKDDKFATLESKGNTFTVPVSDIEGNVNDKVSFEVVSLSDSKIELKQLNKSQEIVSDEKIKQASSEEILEMFKSNNLYVENDVLETSEEELKDMQAREIIRKIQSEILYSSNNTSDSAILELLANNISINKITLSILSQVTREIDKKPLYAPTDEEIAEITNKYLKEHNISPEGFEEKSQIIKALKDNGLNVTESNITQIENAISKFENAVKNGNFEELLNFEKVDIDTLVQASFSNTQSYKDVVSENEQLYKDLAQSFGLTLTDDLKDIFNSFLALDIDISKENIDSLQNIYTTLENTTTSNLIDKMVQAISNGQNAKDINVLDMSFVKQNEPSDVLLDKTLEIKDTLSTVTKEHIAYLIVNGKVVTINDIVSAVNNNQVDNVTDDNISKINDEHKNILMLMQKLTFKSAYNLSKSGIDIDTKTVTDAIAKIDELNNQSYKIALSSVSAENTEENMSLINSFFNKINALDLLKTNYLSKQIDGEQIIQNVADYKNLYANSINGYEVFETTVSQKWNDKITNYEEQILPILKELGLEPTDENIKACTSLIKTRIDLTAENIIDVKNVDMKIDRILNTLHPNIVASMIKDNINPLNLNIDEILDYIKSFENVYGDNLSDKIAKNIALAQKDDSISQSTVDAMKAFYKALNIISKNDSVSIAKTLDTHHDLTIKNLLDVAKYYDKTKGMTQMVSEAVGDETIEITQNANSIKNVIESALQKEYEQNLIDKLSLEANYKSLSNLIESNDSYEDKLVEDVINVLEEFNQNTSNDLASSDDVKAYFDKLNLALSNTPLSINFLIDNNVPLTVENLATFKEMIAEPFKLRDRIKKAIEEESTLGDSFKEVSKEDLSSLSGVGSIIDVQIGDVEEYIPKNIDLALEKSNILSSLNFMNLFNKNEDSNINQMVIKLPLSDEVTTLNMYVLDEDFESKETKSINFSIQTDYLGKIEANLNISLNSADISINGDFNGINFLKDSENEIKELFLQNGYKDVSIEFNSSDIVSMFNRGIYGK